MTDQTAHSYVDQYAPPTAGGTTVPTPQPGPLRSTPPTPAQLTTQPPATPTWLPQPVTSAPVEPLSRPTDSNSQSSFRPPLSQTPISRPVVQPIGHPPAEKVPQTTLPPTTPSPKAEATVPSPSVAETSQKPATAVSQTLEDQNIFFLLGVMNASDAEKEAFLDELQQVIWEDFLENDVQLLLTDDEAAELKRLTAGKPSTDLEQQEAVVNYLEKLIPDLEEIMLEKALELKGDMVKERLAGMKEYFASQPEKLQSLNRAEPLLANDQWHDLAELLNTLSA